jgi:intracellular multiplication protein IcmL
LAEDELEIVRLKNDFYRDGFNKIFLALILIGVAIGLLLLTSFYLHTRKPSPVVFVTDDDGRVFGPAPLDKAFLKDADLIQWVNDAIVRSFNFDFINYKDQLANIKSYYTDNGYSKLLALLGSYASESQVENGKLFVSAGASGTPVMYNEGIIDGRYAWILHFPIGLHYSSGNKNSSATINLEITVIRTQVDNEIAGIAIENIGTYTP